MAAWTACGVFLYPDYRKPSITPPNVLPKSEIYSDELSLFELIAAHRALVVQQQWALIVALSIFIYSPSMPFI